MRDRYLPIEGFIKSETDKAFLLEPCEFDLGGVTHSFNNLWVPKSVTHEDSLDTVDEAVRGDKIEVHVVEWWLNENH